MSACLLRVRRGPSFRGVTTDQKILRPEAENIMIELRGIIIDGEKREEPFFLKGGFFLFLF